MRYGDVIWYLFVDARGCQHHGGQQRTTQVLLHLYDDHEHSRRAQHSSANEAGHCHDATRSWQWVRLMPLFGPMPTSVWVTSTRLSYDTLVSSGDTSWWLCSNTAVLWRRGVERDDEWGWLWVRLMPLFWPMPTSVWVTSARLSYDTLVSSGDFLWWLFCSATTHWRRA